MADDIGLSRGISALRRGGERTTGAVLGGIESKSALDRQAFMEAQQGLENMQKEKIMKMESIKNMLPYMDVAEQPGAITEMMNLAGVEGEFNPGQIKEFDEWRKKLVAMEKDPNITPQQKLDFLKGGTRFMTTPALKKPATEIMEARKPAPVGEMFAKPTIKDYTQASIEKYNKSGNPADLVPRTTETGDKSKDAFSYMKTVLQKPDEFGMIQELDAKTARAATTHIDELIKEFPKASAQKIGELAIQRVETERGTAPGATPPGEAQSLTREQAQAFLKDAGGDKVKARQLAKDAGFTF